MLSTHSTTELYPSPNFKYRNTVDRQIGETPLSQMLGALSSKQSFLFWENQAWNTRAITAKVKPISRSHGHSCSSMGTSSSLPPFLLSCGVLTWASLLEASLQCSWCRLLQFPHQAVTCRVTGIQRIFCAFKFFLPKRFILKPLVLWGCAALTCHGQSSVTVPIPSPVRWWHVGPNFYTFNPLKTFTGKVSEERWPWNICYDLCHLTVTHDLTRSPVHPRLYNVHIPTLLLWVRPNRKAALEPISHKVNLVYQ